MRMLGYLSTCTPRLLLPRRAAPAADRPRPSDHRQTRLARRRARLDAILQPRPRRSGDRDRPAMDREGAVAGGRRDRNQAWARWRGRGRTAVVPRLTAMPKEVVARIHEAGGLASMAHPGLSGHDEWLPGFAADGLDALEAYHSNHDSRATDHYLSEAARLGLVVTGGSDYHADEAHGADGPGSVSLPRDAYAKLVRLKVDTATRIAALALDQLPSASARLCRGHSASSARIGPVRPGSRPT